MANRAVATLLLLCAASVEGATTTVTPVQKVVTLLSSMLEKGKSEKHEEQVQFAAYKQFCDDTSVEKKRTIKEAGEAIDTLKADIQKYIADAAQLTKEIAEHDADISVWGGDEKAASKVREIEKTDYDTTHKDYSESVDALQRAIAVLKKQAFDRSQTSSLVELKALKALPLFPAEAKKAIDTFFMQDPETEGVGVEAPEANAYEFQSHGVIDMLEKLLDKFVDERTQLEKEESNSRHAFELLMQDLKSQIEQATEDRGTKAENKAKSLQAKADAQGELTDTSSTKADDEKYLHELTAGCGNKASDFESRQQLRTEELQALEKAIEIISSNSVSGAAEKHLPALTQATSLAQFLSEQANPAQERVARFLRERADNLNSHILSALAVRVETDPFGKVKKMIKDLIVRLMEEANEEAEHKGWCDTELGTNEQTRKEKTSAVEMLHAEIDELGSSIAKLTEDITELTAGVSDLSKAMAEATDLRQKEEKTNTATIMDAAEAQSAVAQALVVLRDFYVKAGDATALVQQKKQPDIFDAPYKGMAAESGGVIGMLEVIESDFARLETETEAAEDTAQREYDSFMTASKVDNAQKQKDIEHKTSKKQDQSQALTSKNSDLDGTQKELDAALAYYEKLKPSCVDAGVTYDDRVGRRKEEVESLQEALRILNGEDIA